MNYKKIFSYIALLLVLLISAECFRDEDNKNIDGSGKGGAGGKGGADI